GDAHVFGPDLPEEQQLLLRRAGGRLGAELDARLIRRPRGRSPTRRTEQRRGAQRTRDRPPAEFSAAGIEPGPPPFFPPLSSLHRTAPSTHPDPATQPGGRIPGLVPLQRIRRYALHLKESHGAPGPRRGGELVPTSPPAPRPL